MQKTNGAFVGVVLWTSALGIWLAVTLADNQSVRWLAVGALYLWGVFIFSGVGASIERMTDSRAGFYNGALSAALIVLFVTLPQLVLAIWNYVATQVDPVRLTNLDGPTASTLGQWLAGVAIFTLLFASTGAFGGWLVEMSRERRSLRQVARPR